MGLVWSLGVASEETLESCASAGESVTTVNETIIPRTSPVFRYPLHKKWRGPTDDGFNLRMKALNLIPARSIGAE